MELSWLFDKGLDVLATAMQDWAKNRRHDLSEGGRATSVDIVVDTTRCARWPLANNVIVAIETAGGGRHHPPQLAMPGSPVRVRLDRAVYWFSALVLHVPRDWQQKWRLLGFTYRDQCGVRSGGVERITLRPEVPTRAQIEAADLRLPSGEIAVEVPLPARPIRRSPHVRRLLAPPAVDLAPLTRVRAIEAPPVPARAPVRPRRVPKAEPDPSPGQCVARTTKGRRCSMSASTRGLCTGHLNRMSMGRPVRRYTGELIKPS